MATTIETKSGVNLTVYSRGMANGLGVHIWLPSGAAIVDVHDAAALIELSEAVRRVACDMQSADALRSLHSVGELG